MSDISPGTAGGQSKPRQVAEQTRTAAGQAAGDVAGTAKEQAHRVATEARTQARSVASEIRGKLSESAQAQNGRLVGSIRQTADHLDEMRGDRSDSPAAAVVSRIADGGRQFADYLDRNGPDGVLREVEDFARRRPGAFLATALAAGFVVGRLGKSVAKADPDAGKPAADSFTSDYERSSHEPAPAYDRPTAYETSDADTVGYVPASTGSGYVTPATTQYAGRRPAGPRRPRRPGIPVMTAPYRNEHDDRVTETSVGEIIGNITDDLSQLFRQEVELAKAEIRQEATKAGKAAGMLGGAGFAGYLAVVLLSFAVVFGLSNVMDPGWAALIVAIVWGAIGAVLFVNGRKKLKTVDPVPRRTAETLKEDARWLKNPTG
jgi:hypothetical protein